MSHLSRRQFVSRASATAAAIGATGTAQAAEKSPLRSLYHEWNAAVMEYSAGSRSGNAAEDQALIECITEYENQAALFTPRSVEDFAWKIIFVAEGGAPLRESVWSAALACGAYKLVGLPIPSDILEGSAYFRPHLDRRADCAAVAQVDELVRRVPHGC